MTVLRDLLREGHRELAPDKGPVIIQTSGLLPYVRPLILPPEWQGGFRLLTREQILALEQPDRYYLFLSLKSPPATTADVTISVFPVGEGLHLCCWTSVRRYERTNEGWRFVRRVGGMVH